MKTTDDKPKSAIVDEALQTVIERVQTKYEVRLKEGEPIKLFVDGLCENPGAMHLGLFARQGEQCLFAEHMYVGHGTCNEAEYLALKCGLQILQSIYPEPGTLVIPPAISATDIKDVTSLVAKFRHPTDAVSDRIARRLPETMKQPPANPGAEQDEFQARLAAELNGIIHGPPIYDEEEFSKSEIKLRPATLQLLDQNPRDTALARLNRLLLEDVYAMDIVPRAPVQTFSDSQLVTKQVAGLWRANSSMQPYCMFLRKLRKTYFYDLTKICREQNQIADSLAQKYIEKNSGRNMSLENGRFNSVAAVPPIMKKDDLFNAVVSQETKDFLKTHNLRHLLLEVVQLAGGGQVDEAVEAALELEAEAREILDSAPKSNEMLNLWLRNTRDIIQKSVPIMIDAIKRGDAPDLAYVAEELSRTESTGSEIYDVQVEMAMSGLASPRDDADEPDGELSWNRG